MSKEDRKKLGDLLYYKQLELRNLICNINLDEFSDEENWELQGSILFRLGFNQWDSKYPSDTYVGVSRLKGWEYEKNKGTIVTLNNNEKLFMVVLYKLISNMRNYKFECMRLECMILENKNKLLEENIEKLKEKQEQYMKIIKLLIKEIYRIKEISIL